MFFLGIWGIFSRFFESILRIVGGFLRFFLWWLLDYVKWLLARWLLNFTKFLNLKGVYLHSVLSFCWRLLVSALWLLDSALWLLDRARCLLDCTRWLLDSNRNRKITKKPLKKSQKTLIKLAKNYPKTHKKNLKVFEKSGKNLPKSLIKRSNRDCKIHCFFTLIEILIYKKCQIMTHNKNFSSKTNFKFRFQGISAGVDWS
jgi:hypothetical protein